MKKIRLFTPGPVMIPEDTMLEMARPIDHHRTAAFRESFKELGSLLQYVFQTSGTCVTITGSGTAAAEAAIVGCCPPGHKALVGLNGKFAERWAKVCANFGIPHTAMPVEWGTGVKASDVEAQFKADPKLDTVIIVHSETSTTALSDVAAIARVTRAHNAILIVDGITAVGAIPVKMDEWGVDVYITGSQKALMLPPGLGFLAVNDRAWQRIDSGKTPTLYNDLKAYRKSLEKNDVPYTPANTLILGAVHNLRKIKERGLENIWKETALFARATRAAVAALGLKTYAKDPTDSVTGIWVPQGVDEAKLRKTLRGDFGQQWAGGQGDLEGKIVRITHMGYMDIFDTLGGIAALELALKKNGYNTPIGAGVSAAQKVFAEALG
ncbi:MAG: serine-pyruvate aminotransferase [Planctomycetota bacterium]|nr:MAG: serine-pyruvate aminotransferase [Planctomycetota bacterium]